MTTSRTQCISSFIVMDVMEKACEMECRGENIIHLEVGEPDFDCPQPVKQAAMDALAQGRTHYTHSLGMPELRQAICDHYRATYGGGRFPGPGGGDLRHVARPCFCCFPPFWSPGTK